MGIAGASGDAVIRIRVQRLDPLTGIAASETGAEVGFEGWMELIGAIANLIGSPDRPDTMDQRAASMSSEHRIEP